MPESPVKEFQENIRRLAQSAALRLIRFAHNIAEFHSSARCAAQRSTCGKGQQAAGPKNGPCATLAAPAERSHRCVAPFPAVRVWVLPFVWP
jgi:hypothetical protein